MYSESFPFVLSLKESGGLCVRYYCKKRTQSPSPRGHQPGLTPKHSLFFSLLRTTETTIVRVGVTVSVLRLSLT